MVWMRRLPAGLLTKDEELEEFIPESQPLGMWPRYEEGENLLDKTEFKAPAKPIVDLEAGSYAYVGNTADLRSKQNAAEATVLLMEREGEQGLEPSIYREWAGGGAWINWREERFTIGRLGEQVSYEEEAHGISRLHLELEREAGAFRAKDLGSRNGSTLNGQTMIPYKSYPLTIGDVIQLAGSSGPKYELKMRG
jgi:hypothetical protein